MPEVTRRLAVAGLAALVPTMALAHVLDPDPMAPIGWSFEPWVIAPMLVSAVLFATGWARLRRRSSLGRRLLDRRAALFAAGWVMLASALVSPLHALGARSFTAHMLEHELMMLAAAPLFVASRPLSVMLWSFPATGRRALGAASRSGWVRGPFAAMTEPITATLVQAAALWLWHAPSLFDLALSSEGWHVAQHLCFMLSALLFWSAMLERRRGVGVAVLCLFATSVVTGALGALMAVSESPWYSPYTALGMTPYGLSPAQDQQAAGLLMWIPGGLVHAVAALALLAPALVATVDPPQEKLDAPTA